MVNYCALTSVFAVDYQVICLPKVTQRRLTPLTSCPPPPLSPRPAGAHAGRPEPGGLLQHVHSAGEEASPAPPGVGQEEPPGHGLLWPDRVPEEDPVLVRADLPAALHPAFHAVQQHASSRGRPGQRHGTSPCATASRRFSWADGRQM